MIKRVLYWSLGLMVLGSSGCYATTIRSGLTPQPKPDIEYDEKWHHGVVLGLAELSGPYDLSEICPAGWAEIETHTSFINGLVDLITGGVYNPQSVSIRCAVAPVSLPPAAAANR
jgi:hypothetical protein